MAEASFPCRSRLGVALRDRIELCSVPSSGQVAIVASREGGTQTISVHLSPEDILQFATEALRLADICAESSPT